MLGLIGRRKRLTRRGKQVGWQIASEVFSETGNELDRALTEADHDLLMERVQSRAETLAVPPWVWQIVLAYIAQILINWIIEKYLTPPQFPASEVGDDDDMEVSQ